MWDVILDESFPHPRGRGTQKKAALAVFVDALPPVLRCNLRSTQTCLFGQASLLSFHTSGLYLDVLRVFLGLPLTNSMTLNESFPALVSLEDQRRRTLKRLSVQWLCDSLKFFPLEEHLVSMNYLILKSESKTQSCFTKDVRWLAITLFLWLAYMRKLFSSQAPQLPSTKLRHGLGFQRFSGMFYIAS